MPAVPRILFWSPIFPIPSGQIPGSTLARFIPFSPEVYFDVGAAAFMVPALGMKMLSSFDCVGAWRGLSLALALVCLCPGIGTAESARDSWIKSLVAQLKIQRRYPSQASGEGGTAKVLFHIDREGHLISAVLAETTGDPVLDQEALAIVKRAQPFAPPPPELADGDLTFLVPIVFAPRRTSEIIRLEETTLKLQESKPNDATLKARLEGVCRGC
ncbi:energy transducer TonB family protein [Bradyrhizobium oligotrophicum S58]